MTECPEIEVLTSGGPPSGAIADHLARCEACSAVRMLTSVREERQAGRDDECVSAEVRIALWHLDEIDEASRAELIAHLEVCSRCNEAAVRLRSLPPFAGEVTEVRTGVFPIDRAPRPERNRHRIAWIAIPAAAALAALTALVVVAATSRSHRADPERLVPAAPQVGGGTTASEPASVVVEPIVPLPSAVPLMPTELPPAPPEPAVPSPTGNGYFTAVCDPGCDVNFAGLSLGAAPVVRATVPAGRHDVVFTRGGVRKRISVTIIAGQTTARRVKMDDATKSDIHDPWASGQTAPGFLTVICNPICNSVQIDGKNLGPSPVIRTELKPGTHKVELTRGDVKKWVIAVVQSGETSSVSVKMEKPVRPLLEDRGF